MPRAFRKFSTLRHAKSHEWRRVYPSAPNTISFCAIAQIYTRSHSANTSLLYSCEAPLFRKTSMRVVQITLPLTYFIPAEILFFFFLKLQSCLVFVTIQKNFLCNFVKKVGLRRWKKKVIFKNRGCASFTHQHTCKCFTMTMMQFAALDVKVKPVWIVRMINNN